MAARRLGEPLLCLTLFQTRLLLADIDQLLEVEGTDLGRVREPRRRRETGMQNFKLGTAALGEVE
jgi:hypothetical protein